MLGSLPKGTVDHIVKEAQRLNQTLPKCTQEEASELAQVQSALAHHHETIHSNLFAPFIIPNTKVAGTQTVHWGNVDTGAMVNVVYEGVVRVFEGLKEYWQPFQHQITGVGGKKTSVVAKLVDVPVIMGKQVGQDKPHLANFYVIDSSEYHWIVGLPLLATIQGAVKCLERKLEFTPAGPSSTARYIHCISRKEAQQEPVRAEFRLKSPHLENEEISETCWQAATVQVEEAQYVGEELVEVLGWAQLQREQQGTQLAHPQAQVASHTYHVDSTAFELPQPSGNSGSTEVLVEQIQAIQDMAGVPNEVTTFKADAVHVQEGGRPKKGKPLPKGDLEQLLRDTKGWNIVLTGPDFIGITTTLRQLEQQGYHVAIQYHKPQPKKREEFQESYFLQLIKCWKDYCEDPRALLIEDSPWAYLCRHAVHVAPEVRERCQAALAPLRLPEFTVVFSTSGIEVGRRHPEYKDKEVEYSPMALRQMQQLQLHPSPTFQVDATPSPEAIARRVHSLLSKRAFHVQAGNFEGMNFLEKLAPTLSVAEGNALAQALRLSKWSVDEEGLKKLHRLAEVINFNPEIVNTKLEPVDRGLYYQVLLDNIDAIAILLEDITGEKDVQPFTVETFGDPSYKQPIRLPPAHMKFVREEVKAVKDAGLAKVMHTPWASPCFPVPKPRSIKLRLVIDFRGLNLRTKRSSFPIPYIRAVVLLIGNHKVWCKYDLKSGFWQVPVELDSIQKLGCVTPEELFCWLVMPFGPRNGPPHFQSIVNQAIAEDELQELVGAFIDDLATGGDSHEQCAKRAGLMLKMLAKRGLKAGADKIFFGLTQIHFLGYLIEDSCLKPDPEKVAAIKRLLPPQTRTQLRSFLGLTGYYREFVRGYAQIARPLNELLKEDVAWEWSSKCQDAFEKLRQTLMTEPILAMPEPDRPFIVHTDFSHHALGAILEQRKADNKNHIISCASRNCSEAEAKLGPTDGEILALVFAVTKFHTYLAGTTFTIVTDHSALVHLHQAKTKNPKLARWASLLSNYDFQIQYRAGKVHNNADGLSRCRQADAPDNSDPIALEAALHAFEVDLMEGNIDGDPGILNVSSADLHEEVHAEETFSHTTMQGPRQMLLEAAPCSQCKGNFQGKGSNSVICDYCNAPFHLGCTKLRAVPTTYWYCQGCSSHIKARGISCPTEDVLFQQFLLGSTPPKDLDSSYRLLAQKLTFTGGKLMKWTSDHWKHYPPRGLQLLLLEETHVQHHHIGGQKMYELLKCKFYWPTLRQDCQAFSGHCFECQLTNGRAHGSWQGQLLPLPPGPRCEWSLDLIVSLGTEGNKVHLLSAICCFSKFCVLTVITDKASATVAAAVQEKVFQVFGNPSRVRTDNGTEFKGAFDSLCEATRVKHVRSSPYTSHSNGQVERLHRVIEELASRCLVTLPAESYATVLRELQLTINTTYARSIGCAPYILMFGSSPPSSCDTALPDPTVTPVTRYATAVRKQVQLAHKAAEAAHHKYRSRTATTMPVDKVTEQLQVGKLAMIIRPRNNKLLTTNAGPFLIVQLKFPHVHLQSLTHSGTTLVENVKNVRPLHVAPI